MSLTASPRAVHDSSGWFSSLPSGTGSYDASWGSPPTFSLASNFPTPIPLQPSWSLSLTPAQAHYSSTLTCQGLQELVTAALVADQQIVGGFWVLKLHSQALVAESHFQMGDIRQVVRVILLQPVCRLSPNHRAQSSAAAGCPTSSPTSDCSREVCQKSFCMAPHLQGKAGAGWHYPALSLAARSHLPPFSSPDSSSDFQDVNLEIRGNQD